MPLNGNKTVRFQTDVEDQYFDRVSEPGDLTLAVLDYSRGGGDSSTSKTPDGISAVFNVIKSSPRNGTIRVVMNPTEEVAVGDSIRVRVTLTGPGSEVDDVFIVRITDPEKRAVMSPKQTTNPGLQSGLPQLVLVRKDRKSGGLTWDDLGGIGIDMDYQVVMYPSIDDGDVLDKIYINLDSQTFLGYRSKLSTSQQIELAQKRYISSVIFHVLFLYSITKSRKYLLRREATEVGDEDVAIGDYLVDLFGSHYAEFLLNFEVQELMESLD